MLLASPDDTIDPVVPGQGYDKEKYHRFVKPPQWHSQPEVLSRLAVVGDWVWFEPGAKVGDRLLAGAEGRVLEDKGDLLVVRLGSGFGQGSSNAQTVEVPKVMPKVMAFFRLQIGKPVKVKRGEWQGKVAMVLEFGQGMITIQVDNTNTTVPVEWVQPIQE
jgi:hypothetical protein